MPDKDNASESELHSGLSSQRRAPAVRLVQRKQISRMLTLGHSQSEIAEHLQVSEATVSREVSKLRESFQEQTRASLEQLQINELGKLNEVETAAWLNHSKTNSNDSLNTLLRVIKTRSSIMGLENPDARIFIQRRQELIDAVTEAITSVVTDPDLLIRLVDRMESIQRNEDLRDRGAFGNASVKKLSFEKPADVVEVDETEKLSFSKAPPVEVVKKLKRGGIRKR